MKNLKKKLEKLMLEGLIYSIVFYQKVFSINNGLMGKLLRPVMPVSWGCRFYPSCSHYAILSLRQYGLVKGFVFSIYRIIRCNPLGRGGFDPIK